MSTTDFTLSSFRQYQCTGDGITFPAGTDRTVKPTQPNPADFETAAEYQAGLNLFNARRSLYIKYVNEKAVSDGLYRLLWTC